MQKNIYGLALSIILVLTPTETLNATSYNFDDLESVSDGLASLFKPLYWRCFKSRATGFSPIVKGKIYQARLMSQDDLLAYIELYSITTVIYAHDGTKRKPWFGDKRIVESLNCQYFGLSLKAKQADQNLLKKCLDCLRIQQKPILICSEKPLEPRIVAPLAQTCQEQRT